MEEPRREEARGRGWRGQGACPATAGLPVPLSLPASLQPSNLCPCPSAQTFPQLQNRPGLPGPAPSPPILHPLPLADLITQPSPLPPPDSRWCGSLCLKDLPSLPNLPVSPPPGPPHRHPLLVRPPMQAPPPSLHPSTAPIPPRPPHLLPSSPPAEESSAGLLAASPLKGDPGSTGFCPVLMSPAALSPQQCSLGFCCTFERERSSVSPAAPGSEAKEARMELGGHPPCGRPWIVEDAGPEH